MDQTPPEKMTLEQTMEGLKEWKDGLSATLQRILSSDPSSHLVFRKSIETHYKRDLEILSSALLHLEGAQADKVRDENGLRPCPFCGSRAEIVRAIFYGKTADFGFSKRDKFSRGCWVVCRGEKCSAKLGYNEAYDDCEGGDFETEDEARNAWNGVSAMAAQTEGERP